MGHVVVVVETNGHRTWLINFINTFCMLCQSAGTSMAPRGEAMRYLSNDILYATSFRRADMTTPVRAVKIPDSVPEPESAEDLARAIFRDADRKLDERLAAKRKAQRGSQT